MAVSSACSADKDPPILNLAKGGAVGAGRALGLRSCVEGGRLAGARTRASRARSPPALLPPAQLLGGSCLLEWEGLVGGEYPSPAS